MEQLPITGYDMAVIGVLLLSGIIAFARGFVRELLSVAALIGATLAALWGAPTLSATLGGALQPDWLRWAVVTVGLFLAVFIVITIVTTQITNLIRASERVGFFDRTLGFVFGVARGLLLVALAHLVFVHVATPEDTIASAEASCEGGEAASDEATKLCWVVTARTYPLVKRSAALLQSVGPTIRDAGLRASPDLAPGDAAE